MSHRWISIFVIAVALLGNAASGLRAQTTITAATTTLTDGADATANGFTYRNQTLALDTFTAGGETYAVTGQASQVFVRRGSSGVARSHIWYETASNAGDRFGPYITNIEDAILGNNLNLGIHNMFANVGGSSANIERVDLIVSGGMTAAEGFAIPVLISA